jgi:flagellar hook-associated protein 2
MADINIPGVTDKYKTNDLVAALVAEARLPLTREEEKLETYKSEQESWRTVNKNMSALRESVRSLYSFDNPFNQKISSSTEENAITADPGRDANLESFKIEVLNIASADRFLSAEINKEDLVPEGKYTYIVGEKTISFNWKGGKLSDFASALNRRSTNVLKASIIGVSKDSQSLLIESLITGEENALEFQDNALDYALDTKMIQKIKNIESDFSVRKTDLRSLSDMNSTPVSVLNNVISVPPNTGFELPIPSSILQDENNTISFVLRNNLTASSEQINTEPEIPSSGYIQFKDITLSNIDIDSGLTASTPSLPVVPVVDDTTIFVKTTSGKEIPLQDMGDPETETKYSFKVSDYDSLSAIVIRNRNTGKSLQISELDAVNVKKTKGFEPVNPVDTAQDARIKYQGISMTRPTNKIDDIVPNVTLNIHDKTTKPATITIDPDTESAKEAIITFVGKYNQLIAEINILTQTKPEIITELEYFTDDEQEKAQERLGMFQSEFSLTSSKTALNRIVTNVYKTDENANITMLSQIGISSKASSGGSGVNQSQLRGYLEINEKDLDKALKDNMVDIKNLFGYDTDEDKIIDNGIALLMDKNLQSYVQIGGIIANKTSALDTRIKTSETTIQKLETQVANKESELKRKYGNMESTLSNLESQSNSISNFNKSSSD